jgi:hypothetical protein
MDITIVQYQGRVLVTLLRLSGDLNGASYLDLIAKAKQLYAAGARHMIIDLANVPRLSSAGLLAIHQVAMVLRGETPPDPESGWQAFHTLADDLDSGIQRRIKLLNPRPQARQALERGGLMALIEVALDLDLAIASFMPVPASIQRPNRQMRYLRMFNLASRVRRTTMRLTPH